MSEDMSASAKDNIDRSQVFGKFRIARQDDVQRTGNRQEQVVKVVSDSSGKRSQTFKLLRAHQLEFNGFAALQFLLQLEEALDIEIDDEDAAKMDSVGDVLDYLAGLDA